MVPSLHHRADIGDARGLQKLAQLGELGVFLVLSRCDQKCPLACSAARPLPVRTALNSPISTLLH
jgi:hypothetical protein